VEYIGITVKECLQCLTTYYHGVNIATKWNSNHPVFFKTLSSTFQTKTRTLVQKG